MFELDFSQKNLEIQKSVVIQEFKQRYLNQPYGDAMLNLRPLAYKLHPYRWATIGMDISHIQNVGLSEVKEFFFSHYAPNNAILSLTGNITPERGFNLAEKWFGPIPYRNIKDSVYTDEPEQISERILTIEKDVPSDALYKAWHTCSRGSEDFHALDVATDLLAAGESSRLYTNLVKKQNLFSEINAYLTSEADPGLLVLYGRLMKDIDIETADRAVNEIIDSLKNGSLDNREIEKVRNKFESSTVLANTSILNKAISISFYEMLGSADLINREVENYCTAGKSEIVNATRKYLTKENCSTLYYLSSRKNQG